MSIKFKYSLILSILLIAGCDRPGVIRIINKFPEEIIFSYTFKSKYNYMDTPSLDINSGEVGLIYLGFGTRWTELFIYNFSEDVIDTIYLKVGQRNYYCSDVNCKNIVFNMSDRKSKRIIEVLVDSVFIDKVFILH